MKRACGKLGIRILYAKPYSPESKGKQEGNNKERQKKGTGSRLVKSRGLW